MVVRAHDMRRDGWLASVGAVALLSTTFLPWLGSGTGDKTSYDVVTSAEDLGLLEGWGGASMATMWYSVPILIAAIVVLQMIGRWAFAGLLAMLAGAIAVVGSVLVLRSHYEPLVGSFLTLVCGGVVMMLGARVDMFRKDVTRIQPW